MEQRHEAADRVLCVVPNQYLKAPCSTLERDAALGRPPASGAALCCSLQ